MKAPKQIDSLDLNCDNVGIDGAYPPLRFIQVRDAELGNGDYYGLYWPYGRENQEPIVCDTLHDEWGLEVCFSSVLIFIKWLELNDWDRGDVEVEDPALVTSRFAEAKALLHNQPEEAITRLRGICEDFPESANYWFTLSGQLRRIGDHTGAYQAAIRAFASNWVFGMPPNGILKLLQNAKGNIDDPVVVRSSDFTMKYGGTKENSNYSLLKACISEYLLSSTPVLGLLLNQNYGYMMSMETTAFQDRYHYNFTAWIEEHTQLCKNYLVDSRKRA